MVVEHPRVDGVPPAGGSLIVMMWWRFTALSLVLLGWASDDQRCKSDRVPEISKYDGLLRE